MPCDGRFGGHIVSGHIDGTGILESRRNEGNAVWFRIRCPENLLAHIVEKGSVALDGISLTVAAVDSTSFSVSVIPHTGKETTIMERQAGDSINIETDIVAKYVQKMLMKGSGQQGHSGGLTMQYLEEMGI
jgi:riboflavin synthase